MIKRTHFIKNVILSNFRRLNKPYKVTFALTYRCNLRCRICNIWKNQRQDGLSVRNVETIFKGLPELGWLDLTGGEVTLRDDIVDAVRTIAKSARRLLIMHITTNGQSPHKAQELAKEVLKRGIIPVINVSIDGPREVHDSLRGKPGAYDSGIETFRLLKALKRGHYFISCTISDYNVEHLDGLVTSLRTDIPGFSYSDLHFNLFHASPHYYQNDDVDSSLGKAYIALGRHLRKAVNGNFIKRMLEERYLRGLSAYLTSGRSPIRCQALGSTCFIDPYGNVYPCGMYGQVVGNLPECGYDMARLWNSEAASTVRSGIEREQCRGCWSPCEAYPALLGNLRRALSIKQEP